MAELREATLGKKTCGAEVLLWDLSFCRLIGFDTGSAMSQKCLTVRKFAFPWKLIS